MSFEPGSQVMVQWSDGNQYAAQVVQYQSGHVLVGFPNGQQQWVGEQHVSQAGPVGGYPPVESDSYAHQEMAELQQLIARVEGQGVPLCGVDPNDPATLWRMVFAIDERGRLGIPRDLAVRELGFSSEEHFDMVMGYVQAKWSYLGTDDEGRPTVLQRPEYQDAIARASMGQMMDKQAAAASADPGLLAPVDGVTIEQWAQASVLLGSLGANASLAEMHQKLAEIGLDKATYDNATAGWTAAPTVSKIVARIAPLLGLEPEPVAAPQEDPSATRMAVADDR